MYAGFGDEKACDSGEGSTGVLEIETGETKGKEKVEGGVESAMDIGVEPIFEEEEIFKEEETEQRWSGG